MASSRVTVSDFHAIWKKMDSARIEHVHVARATFRVGQFVPIIKQKMRFAKAAEQNFSTDYFRVAKVIERRP